MKYFLDLPGAGNFILYETESEKKIVSGKISDIGIEENDPDFTNKFDNYFEKEFGISPEEWEVG